LTLFCRAHYRVLKLIEKAQKRLIIERLARYNKISYLSHGMGLQNLGLLLYSRAAVYYQILNIVSLFSFLWKKSLFWNNVLAPGSICSLYFEIHICQILKYQKNWNEISTSTSPRATCPQSHFTINQCVVCRVVCVKKTNFGAKNKKFHITIFVFVT
jgi:hypothetical protein